mmetsp:Transcript_4952/g.21205  ORF Transcript_4952/g.21205 Transcript_4952/m.21205 type:complete len:238 (-) Transcript_4952:909-1622(-)
MDLRKSSSVGFPTDTAVGTARRRKKRTRSMSSAKTMPRLRFSLALMASGGTSALAVAASPAAAKATFRGAQGRPPTMPSLRLIRTPVGTFPNFSGRPSKKVWSCSSSAASSAGLPSISARGRPASRLSSDSKPGGMMGASSPSSCSMGGSSSRSSSSSSSSSSSWPDALEALAGVAMPDWAGDTLPAGFTKRGSFVAGAGGSSPSSTSMSSSSARPCSCAQCSIKARALLAHEAITR